jgi:hypothetical protein
LADRIQRVAQLQQEVIFFALSIYIEYTAKTHTKNAKQILLEKELRGLIPHFHIYASVSDLYNPRISSAYFAAGKYVDLCWEYLRKLLTDT